MTFGIAPFAATPFSTQIVRDNAVVSLSGVSLNLTLSNSYTVEKTHFVSGFDLNTPFSLELFSNKRR